MNEKQPTWLDKNRDLLLQVFQLIAILAGVIGAWLGQNEASSARKEAEENKKQLHYVRSEVYKNETQTRKLAGLPPPPRPRDLPEDQP